MASGSIRHICVDPPYYDNVQYAECSDFFYVWLRRLLGDKYRALLGSEELTPKEEEAIASVARFKEAGRKAKQLAAADYENKMFTCFREMHRVLKPGGEALVIDMNRHASNAAIDQEVDGMELRPVNAFITRVILKTMLRKRAYAKADFQRMAAATPFGTVSGVTVQT